MSTVGLKKTMDIPRPRRGIGFLIDEVIHELKQPLNQIRVAAQDVRIDVRENRLKTDSLPESMREIESAVDEGARRIDRLRSLAELGTRPFLAPGYDPGEPSSTPALQLPDMCRTLLARARTSFPELDISGEFQPDVGLDVRHSMILAWVVWELIQNAQEALRSAARAPACISVSMTSHDGTAVVRVRDHGCGVLGSASSIFEPFFTTRDGAAGLGLPLARALVHEVGGRLALLKSDQDGSEFEVIVPNAYVKKVMPGAGG